MLRINHCWYIYTYLVSPWLRNQNLKDDICLCLLFLEFFMCHFSPEFVHNVTLIAVHSPLQLCRQDIASLSILLCVNGKFTHWVGSKGTNDGVYIDLLHTNCIRSEQTQNLHQKNHTWYIEILMQYCYVNKVELLWSYILWISENAQVLLCRWL